MSPHFALLSFEVKLIFGECRQHESKLLRDLEIESKSVVPFVAKKKESDQHYIGNHAFLFYLFTSVPEPV
jgi:hypothetical protein